MAIQMLSHLVAAHLQSSVAELVLKTLGDEPKLDSLGLLDNSRPNTQA